MEKIFIIISIITLSILNISAQEDSTISISSKEPSFKQKTLLSKHHNSLGVYLALSADYTEINAQPRWV